MRNARFDVREVRPFGTMRLKTFNNGNVVQTFNDTNTSLISNFNLYPSAAFDETSLTALNEQPHENTFELSTILGTARTRSKRINTFGKKCCMLRTMDSFFNY